MRRGIVYPVAALASLAVGYAAARAWLGRRDPEPGRSAIREAAPPPLVSRPMDARRPDRNPADPHAHPEPLEPVEHQVVKEGTKEETKEELKGKPPEGIDALRERILGLAKKGNLKEAYALLAELCKLGKEAYPTVAALMRDHLPALAQWKSSRDASYDHEPFIVLGMALPEGFLRWLVDQPDDIATGAMRMHAIESLTASRTSKGLKGADLFSADAILKEHAARDPQVARSMLKSVIGRAGDRDERSRETLARLAVELPDPDLRILAVTGLAWKGDAAALGTLLRGEANEQVRSSLLAGLYELAPPVSGYLINGYSGKMPLEAGTDPSGSPLRVGDIILSINGEPVRNTVSIGNATRGGEATAEIYRDGRKMTVRLSATPKVYGKRIAP